MPFIPHTPDEVQQMLAAIGIQELDALFDEIPPALRQPCSETIPSGVSELEIGRVMRQRAAQDGQPSCFIGAGAYEHHIPAAVWEIATRGEFYSAYTPYQAEASQGTLQLLYEYQSMMTQLTGMEVSNASLYDGASALAEAVLMAVRSHPDNTATRILMPRTVHPHYRKTVNTLIRHQGLSLELLDYDREQGHINPLSLPASAADCVALVIPQPNFFGVLEEVDELTDWAHAQQLRVIAVVNPVSLALLKPPSAWGQHGADIVCGEGQPLGIPLASGGPYFGFLCCKQAYLHKMPGRIVGKTLDLEGKPGFTLTLQAREQHIRRAKATSNICTNQGLMVTAATIYMALMGYSGLQRVAESCHLNTQTLVAQLTGLEGITPVFSGPAFHETVLRFAAPLADITHALVAQNIAPGYELGQEYPELHNCLLVCATETKTSADIAAYRDHLQRILARQDVADCSVQPQI